MLGRELLRSELVDHKDLNGLNNRRENLRLSNPLTSSRNRKKHFNSSTDYKGVSTEDGRFRARIKVNGKQIGLGSYMTPELAAAAYDEAAIEHYGEFALTNEMLKKRGL